MLTAERIEGAFPDRPVRFYEQVESTNSLAMEWLHRGAAQGALVTANEQVKGRGRKGRPWQTPPGTALAVSMILQPPASVLWQMSMLGAVAIVDVCDQLGVAEVGIKWPNDVQIAGKKVSGVLPEALWDGDRLAGVVLGMGLNVRVDFRQTALEDHAVSLETVLNRSIDRLDLLVNLITAVDDWSGHLLDGQLYRYWCQRLTTLGQVVYFQHESVPVQGVAEAVDATGALLVRTKQGALHQLVAGDLALGTDALPD